MTTFRRAATRGGQDWFVSEPASAHVRLRLFCFPYAGGGASTFRTWASALPRDIEVCPVFLPGRERRFHEPAFRRIGPLVESLAAALRPAMDRPVALFGHSMGALIAFELARRLSPEPAGAALVRLFLSARAAPHLPSLEPVIHHLPDSEFIAELRRFKGTPQALLDNPELMRVVLPTIRADFELLETHVHQPGPPLPCGITVFGAEHDEWIDEAMLQGWRPCTDASFRVQIMPGDHFFINADPTGLLRAVRDDLRTVPWSARAARAAAGTGSDV